MKTKTLTLFMMLCISHSYAQQYIENSLSLQPSANFTISGDGRSSRLFTAAGTHGSGTGHISLQNGGFTTAERRWNIGLTGTESANNIGSDFAVWGYANNGDYLYHALTIKRSSGNVGIGTLLPGYRLHVESGNDAMAMFTQEDVPYADGRLSITNGTGVVGAFLPTITGRASTGRGIGLYLTGEVEDVVPATNDTAYASLVVDGRSKTGTQLSNANIFTVNSLGKSFFQVKANGSVGIGTTDTKGYKLAVNGSAIFQKVKVKNYSAWPDYVFRPGYNLPSLTAIENFIREYQHLPGMPSASDIAKNDLDLGEMNRKLLEKVEEQMLYILELNKELQALKGKVKSLEKAGK